MERPVFIVFLKIEKELKRINMKKSILKTVFDRRESGLSLPGLAALAMLAILQAVASARGQSWPTYQHDSARSGVTSQELAPPLSAHWVFKTGNPPARGWAEPAHGVINRAYAGPGLERRLKVSYDQAYHVAAVDGMVYFAASGENRLLALDAATGQVRWSFHTGAAPRLAPSVIEGRVYFGADDGMVYCLDTATGEEIWTFRAAPTPDRVVGHGRMTSLWPIRTGVVVEDGVAYFGAGLFAAEGLMLYAVCAETGALQWVNDRYGDAGRANISPQGYLLASSDELIMPSGRIAPVVFDRSNGEKKYEIPGGAGHSGGSYAMLAGDWLFTGTGQLNVHDLASVGRDRWGKPIYGPKVMGWFKGHRVVVADEMAYIIADKELLALPLEHMIEVASAVENLRETTRENRNALNRYQAARDALAEMEPDHHRRIQTEQELARHKPRADLVKEAQQERDETVNRLGIWRAACEADDALILAGNTLYVGGREEVLAFHAATGRELWRNRVCGTAGGLAVADGRLLVSTTTGAVYSFGRADTAAEEVAEVGPTVLETPYENDHRLQSNVALAERIIHETDINLGFALLLNSDEGRLAWALARRTDLRIYTIEPDIETAARARQALTEAGIYGVRVNVEHGDGGLFRFPPYFANLIVCRRTVDAENAGIAPEDLLRVLRPEGGVAYVNQPDNAMAAWLENSPETEVAVVRDAVWTQVTRGSLAGAGEWTHLYADAGNRGSSDDRLTNTPFGVLWFGDPGPRGHQGNSMAPLAAAGRLFVEGAEKLVAYDAYNGTKLWRRDDHRAVRGNLPVLRHAGGSMALSTDGLFVLGERECHRLDPATGELLQSYKVPLREDGEPRRWGWLAVKDGTLFGSRSETDAAPRHWPEVTGHVSEAVFAIDIEKGELRWLREGEGIVQTAIAVHGDAVVFVDRSVTEAERERAIAQFKEAQAIEDEDIEPLLDRRGQPIPRDVRRIVAIDVKSGEPHWNRIFDLTDCRIDPSGGEVSVMTSDGVVVLAGSPWNGHFHREWNAGRFSRRSLLALCAKTGDMLWSGFRGYQWRPLIMGDYIYAHPWAHHLRTGEQKTRVHQLTGRTELWDIQRGYGHCPPPSASANTIFFRSRPLGYYDVAANEGTVQFGGQRPGCWINTIAAGGIVFFPEASAPCDCAFALQGSFAFVSRHRQTAWGRLSFEAPLTPVDNMAINVGAPGDRRDGKGLLWIHAPNHVRRYHWLIPRLADNPGAEWYHDVFGLREVEGTGYSWIYTSGGRGMERMSIPLLGEDDPPALYTVRLHFAEPEELAAGQRVFNVTIQGQPVLSDFDVVAAAGGPNRALVREFQGIRVEDKRLEIRFAPTPMSELQLPILSGVEVIKEGAAGD